MATTEFKDAAEVQRQSLGFAAAVVWVDHPIQNRTADELEGLAAEATNRILASLVSSA